MNDNLIPAQNLHDVLEFCYTVGILPTSYKITMTYEEQVLELIRFIKEEVIPTINNNALATKELQEKFLELVEYVENYLENLDVQSAIDTKLEEMAQSGELVEIIAEYLNTQAVLGFNTVANMKSADNLINGGICKTLGETTRMDGNGAFYKIRTLTSGDVIDEENIISLTNYPTLIAELIPYTKMKSIIQAIPTNERNAIYFGNSYIGGVGSTSGTDGIFNLTKDLFNNAYKFTGSGTGFLTYTDHDDDTFLTKLNQAIASTSIDKNTITDIIVVGAWRRNKSLCGTWKINVRKRYTNRNFKFC